MWLPIVYNFILWMLYIFLLHDKLVPKYGKVGLFLMLLWNVFASVYTICFGVNRLFQQIVFMIPIFIIVSVMYFERIQWRMVVMSLGATLYLIPELLVQTIVYFIYGENPARFIRKHTIYILIIFSLSIIVYLFLKNILDKIYKSRVTQKGKVAIIMTLSVILVALMPITYFFENDYPIVIYSFLILGIVLDVVLFAYIHRYIQIRELEQISRNIQKDNRIDQSAENEQLHELRHDITNYMNALKILQKQKEGNEI